LQQLEFWKKFKLHYTEHNPSVTISIKSNEWLGVQHWISQNWQHITGLSFLPYSEHVYTLAPYEEITQAEYLAHPCRGKRVNFLKLSYYEKVDETDVKKEFACTAAGCEL
jgi:ribonucleoside-diphosphate reductase alpha chain